MVLAALAESDLYHEMLECAVKKLEQAARKSVPRFVKNPTSVSQFLK